MTAPLDLRAYEKDVVRPLRGAQDVLPGDLVTRYAVDVDMTAEDLRERVAEIVALWNSKARGTGPISAVYRAFQRAHDDLTSQQRVQLDAPECWHQILVDYLGVPPVRQGARGGFRGVGGIAGGLTTTG